MKAPKWDAGFPEHSVHGKLMQTEFIRRATRGLKQRRVALDIGAHIGLTSIALAETFRKVYAFEPVRENYECLAANAPSNVAAFKCALLDTESFGKFEMPEGGNSGCWRLVALTGDASSTKIRTLDSFNLGDIDFMKLDTEGTEGMVLEGAHETIKRCKPRIVFEDNGLGAKYYGSQWIDPKLVLEEHGYERIERIRKDEVWIPR